MPSSRHKPTDVAQCLLVTPQRQRSGGRTRTATGQSRHFGCVPVTSGLHTQLRTYRCAAITVAMQKRPLNRIEPDLRLPLAQPRVWLVRFTEVKWTAQI